MHSVPRRLICLSLIFSTSWLSGVVLKTPVKAPQPSLASPTLLKLTQEAGYIFAGTVLSIEPVQLKGQNEVATVRITFRVDQAVRGVSAKQTFSIREWVGLWDSGSRYRVGDQVLLFLYQSSKLGLTSPVNGPFGFFKMNGNGQILLEAERLSALQIKTPVVTTPISSKQIVVNSRDMLQAIRKAGE